MRIFWWLTLLLSLSLFSPAMGSSRVFNYQNFKIEIPDDFLYFELPNRPDDNNLHLFAGKRVKDGVCESILIQSGEHTGSGNIADPTIVAALESGMPGNGEITSSEIKTYNEHQFLVDNLTLDNNLKAVYYVICADNRTIFISFSKTPGGDNSVSSDPDAEALVQSFQFLHPPDIPRYMPHNPLAFYVIITVISVILVVVGGLKYWVYRQA